MSLSLCTCMSVCLSAAACPHYCTDPDVTWGNGRGCTCALLGGFAIGARVALLWQHNANAKCKRLHACTHSMPSYFICPKKCIIILQINYPYNAYIIAVRQGSVRLTTTHLQNTVERMLMKKRSTVAEGLRDTSRYSKIIFS